MNKMKKIAAKAALFTAVICSVSGLTGCKAAGGTNDKQYVIGINQFAEHPSLDNCRLGFIEGLKQEGFTENNNITFDYQNAAADSGIANQIGQNFVSKKYDLICAVATPSAQASFNAAEKNKIPVIFTAVSDPVAAGLTLPDGSPGKTVTGTSDLLPLEKQIAMIREFLPDAKTIGVLYTTSEINSETQIKMLYDIVPRYGFELITSGVSNQSEIPQAVDYLLTQVDCINNLTDNTVVQSLSLIIAKANEANVPVFGSEEEQVRLGCVASESIDYFDLGVKTGKMAARVLKGEDITKMPYETISESTTVAGRKVLEDRGIEVPDSLKDKISFID